MSWSVDRVPPPRTWLRLLLLAAIVALAAYLRLYHLGRPAFWYDEVYSLDIIDRPFLELWGLRKDVHPPLFYMLLSGWFDMVGHGEAGLRLLSVLFSLATLPALYLLGRCIGGVWLGLATSLCFAAAPFSIEYAQELRMYALLGCIAAWTLYGFARLLAEPERAALPLARSDRLGWALAGGGSLLALYTHNLGLLLPFATTVIAVALWWPRPERGQLARNWAIVHALVLLCWAPWFPELLHQVQHSSGYSWIPAPSLRTIVETELALGFGLRRFSLDWTWLWGAGLALLALVGALALPRRPPWAPALLALYLLPAAGALAITWLFSPVYLARTLIWSGLPMTVLLGAGVVALPAATRSWQRGAVVAFLLLLAVANGVALAEQLRGGKGKDDWRDVARGVAALASPDDLVIVPGLGGDPLRYYLLRLAEVTGGRAPAVLDLEASATKIAPRLWHAPDVGRFVRVETPWRGHPPGLIALVQLRFPCHRLTEQVQRSGMVLWVYDRDPACVPRLPGAG